MGFFEEGSESRDNNTHRGLYKWQENALWILVVLSFISVNWGYHVKGYGPLTGIAEKGGYLLDLLLGVGLNVLILWLLFTVGNKIYRRSKKRSDVIFFILGAVFLIIAIFGMALFFIAVFQHL